MSRVKRYWNSLAKNVSPLRKVKLEDARDPSDFIGRTILARTSLNSSDEPIVIADVRGCIAKDLIKHFQINGTHLVSMFSFFIQMLEGRLPSQAEEDEFNLASDVKDIKVKDE